MEPEYEPQFEVVFRRVPGLHYDKAHCDGKREHACRECGGLFCACAPCHCDDAVSLLTLDEVLAAADSGVL